MRGWVRCAPAFSERRERLAENRVCSRLHSPQRLRAVAAVSANHVFAAQKWFDYPSRTKQKQTIKKMELIKTIRTRVGTLRSRIFRTPRAFSGKSRVLPTTQSAAAARRCGCFGEPCFFCCAKNDSIIHHAPNKNRPSKRWSVFVWWARVDSDHRS